MRILGIGDWNDLGDLYVRLQRQGHEVRVHVADHGAHDILAGMIERISDWREQLPWIRAAGKEGIIVFETAHDGHVQDELRSQGYHVIGGSAYGDMLENRRSFAQQVMRDVGLQTLPSWNCSDPIQAADFITANPARYVIKTEGRTDLISSTYVGGSEHGTDVAAVLRQRAARGDQTPLLLTRFHAGIEVGIGGYFNGQRFLEPVCLDWEHKRFFPGNLGELTGEMGTLVTYNGSKSLFERTLALFAPALAASGYVGYINLNTIVDGQGIWPLEFTARFGYPGFAILDALHPGGWADVFQRLIDPTSRTFAITQDYALGVVVTVPPFPYPDGYERLGKGSPITFESPLALDHPHVHLAEVAQHAGQLVCAGQIGYPMVVTGSGLTAGAAQTAAYGHVKRVVIPNLRYRNDIGAAFIDHEQQQLVDWGYLTAQEFGAT